MKSKLPILIVAVGLVAPWLLGCGGAPSTVSGAVSYDGRPVDNGWITFLPVDGKGPTCGGPITVGKYQADLLTPGKKTVQIIGVKAVKFAMSSEEMANAARSATARGDGTGIIDRADTVPADAVGNNAVVEIKPGPQTLDFQLTPPAKQPGAAGLGR